MLEPIFHRTIWGGNRLVPMYGAQAEGLGHLYSMRCKDGDSNLILNGKHSGKRLFDVIGPYPLSIALVDAAQDLSIQVHPGGAAAKYESYYFIDAPKSGCIFCGIGDMPHGEIRASIGAGCLMQHVGRLPVQKGDYVFIEPRTLHAITAGSFVYEIEQGEDTTYRMFDYGRTDHDGKQRRLHLEDAMASLDASLRATARSYRPNEAIAEKTYETQLCRDMASFKNTEAEYACVTIIAGAAMVDGVALKTGMSVILGADEEIDWPRIEKCIIARPLL